jgi:hypothetical protein
MLAMRNAPSIPSGILRSTFFCAAAGDGQSRTAIAATMKLRRRDHE